MRKIILSALVIIPMAASAAPSSEVAWTPELINFVKAGDPLKGRQLAASCAGCHGENGISTSMNYPSLAGQLPTYLYKQLMDYKNDKRQDPMMAGFAKGLSEQDAADLAAWYGSRSPAFQSRSPMVYEQAERMVKDGDRNRILPPCEVCHAANGKGQDLDMPALSGQNASYTTATLKAFKSGERHNDVYSRMRLIAKELSEQEIEELGLYYQNFRN
ncbi:c-type cytochrome [Methylomonas sp. MgM2]